MNNTQQNTLLDLLLAFLGIFFEIYFIKLVHIKKLNSDTVLMLRMVIAMLIYFGIWVYLFLEKDKFKTPEQAVFFSIMDLGTSLKTSMRPLHK